MDLIDPMDNPKQVVINPGGYFVSGDNVVISTLLGSCVAACLYDPVRKIVGMNHFMLSNKRYAKNLPTCVTEAGRYGIHAMELVINDMLKLGAQRKNIQAKAFGGGSLMESPGGDNFFCVGEINSRFIVEFLENEGIPLVNADLGGNNGRSVHFNSSDFSVFVRKIKKTVNPGLYSKEHKYWRERIKNQEQEVREPEIWD